MSRDPRPFISGGEFHQHTVTPVYLEDGYVSPVEPTSSLIHGPSTPRTMQPIQPRNAGHSPQRQYQMNSPMVRASESVSDLVYGFRPKAGWPGVLFQVILQGAFLDDSLKYAQLAFWISFGGNEVPAIRHETEAHYVLPDLGKKRSVLQCIVPEDQYFNNITAVSMTVYGVGRKARVKDAFIGFFQLIPNDGSMQTYSFRKNGNTLIKWLRETTPRDIDIPSNLIPSEHTQRPGCNSDESTHSKQDPAMIKRERGGPFPLFALSQEQGLFSQYQYDFPPQWMQTHPPHPMINSGQQENEMIQYIHTSEEQSPPALDSRHTLAVFNANIIPANRESHPYINDGMSQSPLSQPLIPRRRANTSRIGRPANGYGKLTFVTKPDILGDFNTWTPQERQDNRRIVVFTKSVRGGTVNLDCSYVFPQDYKENMMTISCIRWGLGPPNEPHHKFAGQCVFTSVDIILLIEKLVGHNFNVQEKNRIRRNLEGYSPETIKKEGATHHFFNQVMSYSSPKTRNIEKDIKVFLWNTIVKAMRKIVLKYHTNGGILISGPASEPRMSSIGLEPIPFTEFSSHHSSSESIPAQSSFVEGQYARHTPMSTDWAMPPPHPPSEYPYQYPFDTGSASMIFGSHEDSGETSISSISPQSQVSQVLLPMGFPQDGDLMGNWHQQLQAFERYPKDDSSDILV